MGPIALNPQQHQGAVLQARTVRSSQLVHWPAQRPSISQRLPQTFMSCAQMGPTAEWAPGAQLPAPLATSARASFKAQISHQAVGPATLVSMHQLVSTPACLASLAEYVLELQQDQLEFEEDWRLPMKLIVRNSEILVQATLDRCLEFCLMIIMVICALQATIVHLELDQRRLAQWVLISQKKPNFQSPLVLLVQLALMVMMSASQNAALVRDLQTRSQAPQAANAWASTESSCVISANASAKLAMCLLMAPQLKRIQTSTAKRWSTRGAALTTSSILTASAGLQHNATTNAMEASALLILGLASAPVRAACRQRMCVTADAEARCLSSPSQQLETSKSQT